MSTIYARSQKDVADHFKRQESEDWENRAEKGGGHLCGPFPEQSAARFIQIDKETGDVTVDPECLNLGRPLKDYDPLKVPVLFRECWFRLGSGTIIATVIASEMKRRIWSTRDKINELFPRDFSDPESAMPDATIYYTLMNRPEVYMATLSFVVLPDGTHFLRIDEHPLALFIPERGPIWKSGEPTVPAVESRNVWRDYTRTIKFELDEIGPPPADISELQPLADIAGKFGTDERNGEILWGIRTEDFPTVKVQLDRIGSQLQSLESHAVDNSNNSAIAAEAANELVRIKSGEIDPNAQKYGRAEVSYSIMEGHDPENAPYYPAQGASQDYEIELPINPKTGKP